MGEVCEREREIGEMEQSIRAHVMVCVFVFEFVRCQMCSICSSLAFRIQSAAEFHCLKLDNCAAIYTQMTKHANYNDNDNDSKKK